MSKGAIPSTVAENRFDYLDAAALKVAEDAAKAGEAEGGEGDNAGSSEATKAGDASVAKPALEVDEDLFGDDDLEDIDAELGDMALEDAGMK